MIALGLGPRTRMARVGSQAGDAAAGIRTPGGVPWSVEGEQVGPGADAARSGALWSRGIRHGLGLCTGALLSVVMEACWNFVRVLRMVCLRGSAVALIIFFCPVLSVLNHTIPAQSLHTARQFLLQAFSHQF